MLFRSFRAPSRTSARCSLTRLRSAGRTPHSARLLAPLREKAALLLAWPVQRPRVRYARAFRAPGYYASSPLRLRSLPRLRSSKQKPHDASRLAPLREKTVLLPALLRPKLWVRSTRASRAPGHDSTRRSLTRLRSLRSSDYRLHPGSQDLFLAPQLQVSHHH